MEPVGKLRMNKLPTTKREAVLNMIAKHESGGDYNVVIGGEKMPLTAMPLGHVLKLQDELVASGQPSGAVGRYQIIKKTMKSIIDRNPKTFPLDRPFDEETQEDMANILLDRRGFREFETGKISDEEMALELSKEWASLPNPETGKSYYDGDGINASHHKVEDVFKVLNTVETSSGRTRPKPSPVAGGSDSRPSEIQGDSSRPPMRQNALRGSDINTSRLER